MNGGIYNEKEFLQEDERMTNIHIVAECERLDFKIYSLRDIVWFKQGHLQMDLPEGIDYPCDYKKLEEKGLRRLLRKIKMTPRV